MQKPDLANCIDAVVPLNGVSTADYLRILRTDCAPAIRRLQATKAIGWYCFLIHNRVTAGRKDLPDAFPEPFIHFRFSPPDGIASSELLGCLREPFLHPIPTTLGRVEGIDETAMLGGWADTWWVIGEASGWVLKIVEAHSDGFSNPDQFVQFLHFITNGLGIGMQSIFIPKSFRF